MWVVGRREAESGGGYNDDKKVEEDCWMYGWPLDVAESRPPNISAITPFSNQPAMITRNFIYTCTLQASTLVLYELIRGTSASGLLDRGDPQPPSPRLHPERHSIASTQCRPSTPVSCSETR
jgi:hypothetical protein